MSRKGPSLRRDPKGYAYAKFNGRKINFGRFDDPEAQRRFDAYNARWLLNGRELPDDEQAAIKLTVGELRDQYVAYLERRYDARWQKNNLARVKHALKPLKELFGATDAAAFSPKCLAAVRARMIESERLCRREINSRVRAIRKAFRWAVAEELVPAHLAHALETVEHLRAGDYGTRDSREVRPVDRASVDATLPHLPRPVAAIVEVMWWTGARPSELFGLRPGDLDRSGDVWSAKLSRHKTASKGKRRELFFGPEAQKVLEPFLLRPKDRPLFSPAEAVEEQHRQRRAARATPLYPSHVARYERERAARADRDIGDVYTAHTLRRAVERAVKAANRTRAERGEMPIPNWTPYQLRHAAATRIREQFGIEMVRVLLGHSSATMSEHYAEADLAKARDVMSQAG